MLALYVSVLALAASAQLHLCVHKQAGKPSHQCAATLLTQGQVDAAPTAVSVVVSISFQSTVVVPAAPLRITVEHRLPPSRAPPSLPA
jgi:hypothetical protein